MARPQLLLPLLATISTLVLAGPTKIARAEPDPTLVELTEAPLITEAVPYFTHTVTTITKAGDYTLGLDCLLTLGFGCVGQIIHASSSTVCTVTGVGTKTTTYPCSTSTTFTKPDWDHGCGCTKTKTYWWTPRPCHPQPTTTSATCAVQPPVTITETKTTTQITTTTTTSTAAPSCTSSLPHSCDRFGYLVQDIVMYRVDLETGNSTRVTADLGGDTNAIGYNTLDNFIYGYQITGNRNNLVRITSTGTSEVIANLGINGVNVGDIDSDGYYWLSASGANWWKIDLRPGSLSYGQIVDSGTADRLGYQIADWVYIPSAGRFLYAVATNSPGANTSTLLRFNMNTHVWTVVRQYTGTPNSTWGAQYGINTGIIYASDNRGGQIWAFPVNGGAPRRVTNGPASSSNDGARCVLNVLAPA